MKLNGSAVVREFYRQEVLAQANEDLSVGRVKLDIAYFSRWNNLPILQCC